MILRGQAGFFPFGKQRTGPFKRTIKTPEVPEIIIPAEDLAQSAQKIRSFAGRIALLASSHFPSRDWVEAMLGILDKENVGKDGAPVTLAPVLPSKDVLISDSAERSANMLRKAANLRRGISFNRPTPLIIVEDIPLGATRQPDFNSGVVAEILDTIHPAGDLVIVTEAICVQGCLRAQSERRGVHSSLPVGPEITPDWAGIILKEVALRDDQPRWVSPAAH